MNKYEKEKITTTIRDAIVNNDKREEQLQYIMWSMCCDREKAKQLYFAFLYYASEDYLVYILQRGEE